MRAVLVVVCNKVARGQHSLSDGGRGRRGFQQGCPHSPLGIEYVSTKMSPKVHGVLVIFPEKKIRKIKSFFVPQ